MARVSIAPLAAAVYAASPPSVFQINVSDGGVPKLPIPRARVEADGIVGDRQQDLRHHGSPEQALCLYSLEILEALQGEGHRIEPGSAGENLTLRGLDWSLLATGARLELGSVVIEITDYATPCSKNARYFADGRFQRMSQKRHPGWSRLYARVLTPGHVAVGDSVVLL
jgi:MOSC domain-containing protein YiiM